MKMLSYIMLAVMMTGAVYKCHIAQRMELRVIGLLDISPGNEDNVESYVSEVNAFLRGQMSSSYGRNVSLAIETFGNVTDVDDLLLRIGNTSNVIAMYTEPGQSPFLKNDLLTRPSTKGIPLLDMYPDEDKISRYPSLVSVTLPVDDVTSILVQLLGNLRWSYVQAVYQNSSYFSTILERVHTVAGRANICVLKSFPISDDVTNTMLLNTMQSLGKEHNTSGVLILLDKVLTRRFIEVIKTHRSSSLFHFLTIGNWEDTSVSPILGTLAITREWTFTRLSGSVRSDIPETSSLDTALQFLLHGLDMALPDVLSCQTEPVSDNLMACFRQSLLDVLRRDIDDTYVYNFQGNTSRAQWIKTIAVMNNTKKMIAPIVFYDNEDVPIEGHAVSTSQPFRQECRNNIVQEIHLSEHADVYLVGVFPMHERANTPNGCGDLNPDQVILAEAVTYGVDIINNNMGTLSGLSLGYIIIDSCSLADRTIAQFDQIYSGKASNGINLEVVSQIFGAVGFTGHDEYAPLAGYLHSKDLLTISATAIDSEFSKKDVYPDFMRMVPDQREEISVMFQTLKLFGVKYIGIVYSEEHLNEASASLAIDTADSLDISVVYAMHIAKDMGQSDLYMDNLVDEFIERNLNSTRVLVTFAMAEELLPLFKAMKRRHVEQMMWVGDNSWFTTIHHDEMVPYIDLLDWAFVVGIPTYPVPAFNRHFMQIQNNNSAASAFTRELLNLMETCNNLTNNEETGICNKLHSDMFSHNDAYLVIDSVKALAEGLEELLQTCPLGDFCPDAKNDLASHLREHIFQNHFLGSSGKIVRFDSKGNGPASFGIYQVVPDKEHVVKYQKVGSFEDGSLSVSSDLSIPLDMKKSECSIKTCAHVPLDIFGKPYVYIDGNPMLYGFVKIYKRKDEASCSGEVSRNGYQAMETMVWGVNAINNNTSLLPNVTLGLAVFPTCGISTNTKNIVQSVLLPNLVLSSRGLRPNTTILGIVGGETVGDAIAMETATRALDTEVPVIISSRADVNDGKPHPRLFRTVPSPFAEMDYILELCLQLKWTYIHVIYGQLSDSVVKYLTDITDVNGICIASRNMLDGSVSSDVTRSTLINMTTVEGATVVILVTTPNTVKQVLKEARDLYLLGRLFFVLPFEMYNLKQHLSENDIGLLSSRQDIQLNDRFMDYFLGLNIKDKASDPWFADFWQQANKCNLRFSTTYEKDCSNSEHLSTSNFPAIPSTNGILDSVFSLGHALHHLIRECKTNVSECIAGNRTNFYNDIDRFLIASDFTSPGGSPFKFRDKTSVSKALIVTNVQKSPDGGVRLVDVGTFVNRKLALDMRKLSFYRNGVRVIPESKCLGDCRNCLDPNFVNDYDARVTSLLSAGPILQHKIFTALGVIDILLICISFMFIGIAVYFLRKFHTHKVFNLCLDADTGILIGCVLMTCSSCCYLFTQTKLMCTLQLGTPALSYAICTASLVVKINKTACLRSYLGLQQSSVPSWDFALTYMPLLLVPTIILFFKWMKSDAVQINSTVPGIRKISSIDEVTISWRCSFDREFYSLYMTTFWFVIVEVIIITFSYILRCNKEPEVKQVMWSSTISLVFITGSTLVLMLTGNVEIYGIVMCFVLNLNSMVLTCANFLPAVFILMTEEQREHEFMHMMTQDRVTRMAKFWRNEKSRKKENKGNVERKYAKSLWKQGAELSVFKTATSIEEGT
ncbi:uncharacterized protein LOC117333096 [Pecten maximus]|uniref:uncharacterized protein LOC117333096 n=1 Tax=Pecten maximus TaxID=6579 RepID=UPI001458349A|nr:uncharacterized protein LOC117333096 [Pecten maximus]XP_033748119.1 uncharacterized protein LOC117333096 [Pecten maximus]